MKCVALFLVFNTFVLSVLCSSCNKDVLKRLEAVEKQSLRYQTEIKELKHRLNRQERSRNNRALQDGGRIAFTSYLSRDLDQIAINSPIVFDEILHNDADGYNNQTGIFTAPAAGVYFFTYFVGEKGTNQINTMLAVNNQNYVDVVAESLDQRHNDQSGNAATVKLAVGDTVQVLHRSVGDHIEGGPKLRLSTFTGFLLYQTEEVGSNIIG